MSWVGGLLVLSTSFLMTHTKLSGAVDKAEGRNAIQKNLDMLEK